MRPRRAAVCARLGALAGQGRCCGLRPAGWQDLLAEPKDRPLELAEREATLQLQKAEAVTIAVRTARAELRRLAGLQRAAEAQAAAAAEAAARVEQDAAALRQQKATGWRPKVGQSVFVPRLGKRAKVVAVDATSGALTLQAGLIKIQATPDEVRQQ
ncbi:hypothetical protein ABPG77_001140 [Micractinium sp. CCAP 211/92]